MKTDAKQRQQPPLHGYKLRWPWRPLGQRPLARYAGSPTRAALASSAEIASSLVRHTRESIRADALGVRACARGIGKGVGMGP